MIHTVIQLNNWPLGSWALKLGAVFLLSACAQRQVTTLTPSPSAKGNILLEVPFFPDRSDQCGPSTLASVLSYWGTAVKPGLLKKEIYSTGLKGSLSIDLLLAARSRGMSVEMFNGSLSRVKKELDAGHPLIAFVNYGFRLLPIGHFMVLTGYDDSRQAFYAHSGANKNTVLPYNKFASKWEKTGRWTLLILPPKG